MNLEVKSVTSAPAAKRKQANAETRKFSNYLFISSASASFFYHLFSLAKTFRNCESQKTL